MEPAPRDTFTPNIADGRSSRRRGLFWPVAAGAALVGLALGGRALGRTAAPPPSPAVVDSKALNQLFARYPAKSPRSGSSAVSPTPASKPQPAPPRTQAAGTQSAPSAVSPEPPIEPPGASSGSFLLQAGSFQVKEVADTVARELTDQGFQARSEAYGGPHAGWWHVVRLGPFESRTEAEAMRLKLPLYHAKAGIVFPRPNGVFHVQVACLKSRQPAEDMAEKLRTHAHPARVSEAPDGARAPWYCVRVGPFDSRDEAEGYQHLLEPRENMTGRVIPFAPGKSG